jgi:tRNA-specific 2-thiouridylase
MPLGEMTKSEVRERARRAGLHVYDKPDSTGICFIGERPFRDFLARFLPDAPGAIETPDGAHLGTHRGLAFYTLGQREGLSVGGRRGYTQAPWFVAAKDAERNVLVVVQGHDHPLLSERRADNRYRALAAAGAVDNISRASEGSLPPGRSALPRRAAGRRRGAHRLR